MHLTQWMSIGTGCLLHWIETYKCLIALSPEGGGGGGGGGKEGCLG